MEIKYIIEELRLLGFSRTAYRVWYEFSKRLGIRDASKRLPSAIPDFKMTFDIWKKNRNKADAWRGVRP